MSCVLDVSGARCPGCWMSGVLDVQGVIFEFWTIFEIV